MKRAFYYTLAIVFCFSIFSCEQENLISSEQANPAPIDSSKLLHNLTFKGHYYFLEFDTAYAKILAHGNYLDNNALGHTPTVIAFIANFTDKYTGKSFSLSVGVGQSIFGYSDYPIYSAIEVQPRLDWAETFLQQVRDLDSHGTGSIFSGDIGTVFPERTYNPSTHHADYKSYMFELLHFDTFFDGLDKMANFGIKVTGDSLELVLEGKLKAQYDEL